MPHRFAQRSLPTGALISARLSASATHASSTAAVPPPSEATSPRIQALPLEQLEALAVGEAFSAGVALLDFQGPADLATWLTTNI